MSEKSVKHLVVDTTAFIQNAPLQNLAENMYTVQEVVDEIQNKRQLRRLCVLPYELIIKDVFAENIHVITEFTKKTGDYPSLSATDKKVMALTYQLEKQFVGTDHLNVNVAATKTVVLGKPSTTDLSADVTGFYLPGKTNGKSRTVSTCSTTSNKSSELNETIEELEENFKNVVTTTDVTDLNEENILQPVSSAENTFSGSEDTETDEEDDEDTWITPANVQAAKKKVNSELMEEKNVLVACMTTDFAMQNVLKQMNLNVATLDGRMIRQLRTFILRCYTCFGTTSLMTKQFCPKCGNGTLKKVAVSLDENGKQIIHINHRRPLTGRGKRFSLPTVKGGKHSNNPKLAEDQPMPDQRPTRLARSKNNPMQEDYVAGYSPFVMRDVNSKSAQLCIRPTTEVKHWMRKNPNEARRQRRK